MTIDLEKHKKAVDAFFDKVEKSELVEDIDFGSLVKKYDRIIARAEGLKKASQALARAYKRALDSAKPENKGKKNIKVLKVLRDALNEYVKLSDEVHEQTAPMPQQAINLRVEADKEYAAELAKLDALRNNAKTVLARIQDDAAYLHRESALDSAAAKQLLERVTTLIEQGGIDFIHAVPHDQVLFNVENLK